MYLNTLNKYMHDINIYIINIYIQNIYINNLHKIYKY